MGQSSITIVTACDRKFIWGTCLLLLSLRRSGVTAPVHVLAHNLGTVNHAVLNQFEGVTVFDASDESNHRNIVYQKTPALLTAETDLVMWIDSDCIVTGNIMPLIEQTGEGLQIRMRPEREIAYLFRNRYRRGERRGSLPQKVLDIWRSDVAELQEAALDTSCNAHCFVVHRRYVDFIRHWDRQIRKVIPDEPSFNGVVNDRSYSYFLLDESVMSSLLAFGKDAPPLQPWRMEDDPECAVVHFGGRPKPWERWLWRNLSFFDRIVDLVEWGDQQGLVLPGIPWFFRRENRRFCQLHAFLFEVHRLVRRNVYGLKRKRYV